MIGVYTITNRINKKRYVGQSTDIETRWMQHRSAKDRSVIAGEIRRHGVKNFRFKVVEECQQKDLLWREAFWIGKLNPEYNNGRSVGRGSAIQRNLPRTVTIPSQLHHQLKVAAAKRGVVLKTFVIQTLTKAIK